MKQSTLLAIFLVILVTQCVYSQPLSGTYTINRFQANAGTNFSSFENAIARLTSSGVSGPVTMNVMNAAYAEKLVFDTEIAGSSTTNRVTFVGQGIATPTISTNNNTDTTNYIIRIDGVSHLVFKNLNLLASVNPAYPMCGTLVGVYSINNSDIIFDNVTFDGITPAYYDVYSVLVNGFNIGANNFEFKQCTFKHGSDAIALVSPYDVRSSLLSVKGCTFQNNLGTCIGGNNFDRILLSGNTMSGCIMGVQMDAIGIADVKRNYMYNLSFAGIWLANVGTSGNVFNNAIAVVGSQEKGMVITGSNNMNIVHNTVYTDQAATSYYQLSGNNVNVVNNIFMQNGNGYAARFLGVSGIGTVNYNDYYAPSGTLARWAGVTCSTVGQLQQTSGQNANSLAINPQFVSSIDLHASAAGLDNAGLAVGIPKDIEGQSRSTTTPDIGADEFTASGNIQAFVGARQMMLSDMYYVSSTQTIRWSAALKERTSLTVVNALGEQVYQVLVGAGSTQQDIVVPLVSGIYFASMDKETLPFVVR